ncbi:MAG: peptidyl-prolyl cis-trans isomerase [Planctomycetales bacterium]|nr:peptidyl-prolyl cis-trans isomerase [Planctomycetales bacterium]
MKLLYLKTCYRWTVTLAVAFMMSCAAVPTDGQLFNAGAATAATSAAIGSANAAAATTVTATAAAPAAVPPNIWDFLGLPQIFRGGVGVASRVRHGLNRRLPFGKKLPPQEIPPPGQASPAEGAAGEAMQVEANSEATAKALPYLGNFGCNDCFKKTEPAIYQALQDCSDIVRVAAIETIMKSLSKGSCACNGKACCSLRIREQLEKMGYERDGFGCFVETCPKARRLARVALKQCCCVPIVEQGPAVPNREAIPEPIPAGHPNDIPFEPLGSHWSDNGGATFVSHQTPVDLDPQLLLARVNGDPIHVSDLWMIHQDNGTAPTLAEVHAGLERAINVRVLTIAARSMGYAEQWVANQPDQTVVEAELATDFLNTQIPLNRDVAPAMVQQYWNQHRAEFMRHPSVAWEQITVPVSHFASSDAAYRVAQYCRRYAIQPDSTTTPPYFTDADVVTVSFDLTAVDQLPEGDAAALNDLAVGAISSVIEVPEGYRVYHVLDRRSLEPMTLAEATPLVIERVAETQREARKRAYLAQLRRLSTIWSLPPTALIEVLGDGTDARAAADHNVRPTTAHVPLSARGDTRQPPIPTY